MLFLRLLLARFFYLWGSLHRHFGNQSSFGREHRLALRAFNRAIQLDRNLYSARLDRGILLWRELRQMDEALAEFNALLADEPGYGAALLNRALVKQDMAQYKAALADLAAYLALPPDDEHPEYRLIATRTAALLQTLLEDQEQPPTPNI